MNGAGEEALEIGERAADTRGFFRVCFPKSLLKREMEPAAQLGGGLAREGYRGDVFHLVDAGGNRSAERFQWVTR